MPGDVRLTARIGPKVTRDRYATLDEALAALEARLRDPARAPERKILGREYGAVQQVTGRFEIRAAEGRGGVDVRGDGSAEAYVGWFRKRVVEQRPGESPVQALSRVLRG